MANGKVLLLKISRAIPNFAQRPVYIVKYDAKNKGKVVDSFVSVAGHSETQGIHLVCNPPSAESKENVVVQQYITNVCAASARYPNPIVCLSHCSSGAESSTCAFMCWSQVSHQNFASFCMMMDSPDFALKVTRSHEETELYVLFGSLNPASSICSHSGFAFRSFDQLLPEQEKHSISRTWPCQ